MRATKGGFIVMYRTEDKGVLSREGHGQRGGPGSNCHPPVSAMEIVVYGEKKEST